jgi:amidophosphoribosyltransferase
MVSVKQGPEGSDRYSQAVPIRSGAGSSADDPRSIDSLGTAGLPLAAPTLRTATGDVADDPAPRDACGVFGVFAHSEEVAKLAYYGLYALQHRGQEAAGIAVADGRSIVVYKELGLVAQVFDEVTLGSLRGHVAIGHCRYSTTGGCTWENAQPTYRTRGNGGVALGHNGNLTNTAELAELVARDHQTEARSMAATTDSDLITAMLASSHLSLDKAAVEVLPLLTGAFSLTWCDETTLYAARDRHGVRPLVLGKIGGLRDGEERTDGWVVASETAALDIVGARLVREVAPGELLVIDDDGVRSVRFAAEERHGCLFEYVYLARPDTTIAGRSVHAARVEVGRMLAREAPVDADLVIPVPESGTPAAIGYAEASGIPYGAGLVKNAYVGRTFIQPSQTIRQLGIRLKLNPLREVIEGKRLVVVDDSIVRGNTQRALVRMLRDAGAREVHVRISSPPVRWPCFYGIDFATRQELIAADAEGPEGIDHIRRSIAADSLAYVSLEGLTAASLQPAEQLCRACFDGRYPVRLPSPQHRSKHLLEAVEESETLMQGVDGGDPSPDEFDRVPI